jgi:hypothetical protein
MTSWKTLGVVAIAAIGVLGAGAGARQVKIDVKPERIAVDVDGKLFTALNADKVARKLYLHPLNSASGKRVTRGFPMEPGPGESTDHPHQRGVWIGAEHVTGGDFWENEPGADYDEARAGTVTLKKVTDVRQGADEGSFTITADWLAAAQPDKPAKPETASGASASGIAKASGDGDAKDGGLSSGSGASGAARANAKAASGIAPGSPIITETRTMTFRAPSADTRIIDIDLRLRARTKVTFDDNHDAILGLRLATPFEIAHGGRLLNAEGLTQWDRLRGARSAWVDSIATIDGEQVGVAVMDAPTNFRFPTPWHVREYALVFASPFASQTYAPSAPDFSKALQSGEELTLRYRILIHPISTDVAAAFKEFAGR